MIPRKKILIPIACLGLLSFACKPTAPATGGSHADAAVDAGPALNAACKSSTDCASTQTCDLDTGKCTSSGLVGSTCGTDTDCLAGPDPWCGTSDAGFASGYCSSNCISNSECGPDGICVGSVLEQGDNAPFYTCMQSCKSSSDCRSEYNCVSQSGQQFCLPYCFTDMNCFAGETCDTSTGLCTGTPAADAGVQGGSTTYPATFTGFPSWPQVQNAGGPELTSPQIVPVFFSNDDPIAVAQITDFLTGLGATEWWSAMSEYSIGAPTLLPTITISTPPGSSITDTDIQTWLADQIQGGGSFPQPTPNTVYALHYPEGTQISLSGELSCQYFGGYHSNFAVGGTQVAYAVIPRCPAAYGFTILDNTTTAESHEILEAATDPYAGNGGSAAFVQVDEDHLVWALATGGATEIGDMCELDPEAYFEFTDSPYIVQRFWSNTSVTQGHDPCVPLIPGEVFFNAVPELPDKVTIPRFGTTEGINIALNSTGTVKLDVYSDGPTGAPISLMVQDISSWNYGPSTMDITLSQSTAFNGDQVIATITPKKANPQFKSFNVDAFVITVQIGYTEHFWFGLVGE